MFGLIFIFALSVMGAPSVDKDILNNVETFKSTYYIKARYILHNGKTGNCMDTGCGQEFGNSGMCVDFSMDIDFSWLATSFNLSAMGSGKDGLCGHRRKVKKDKSFKTSSVCSGCCHCLQLPEIETTITTTTTTTATIRFSVEIMSREPAVPTGDTHILAGTQKRRPKHICCGNNDDCWTRARA